MTEYLRDDVYLCPDCGEFHSSDNDEHVEIRYEDMPASVAIEIMNLRSGLSLNRKDRRWGKKRPKKFYEL